jgi:class 3 adenylate cyclase/tetratricopeptide (TPR) repeat protein
VVAERRQLTVMFCDVAGYTELAQRLDPEELREVLAAYQAACSQAIRRFDGHIAQYLGDGVLAYFGYPRAHENDPERAVRAALAIQAALDAPPERRARTSAGIAARVGVHSGLVVVAKLGDEAHQETLALGDTISIAARLQALAEPGGVLISDTTLRLVSGLFITRSLGTPELKGINEPIGVHAVSGSAGVVSRFAATRKLTPLEGRDRELRHLLDCWEPVQKGEGRLVVVSGEAGIGKSRLLHALREKLAGTPHFTLELGCSAYTSGSAFEPAVDLLELGLGFSEQDTHDQRLAKLEQRLGLLPGLRLEAVVPYLAPLLGLPPSARFPLEYMAPALQRDKTLEALLAPILALASRQPLLIACEDLHWSDPSTLELLGRLIDRAPALPMLIVLTFRPDFQPPWSLARPHASSLALSRLTRAHTRSIIEVVAGPGGALPSRLLDQLVERADGVPLFAEELARSIVRPQPANRRKPGGGVRAQALAPAIPATLQGSLMARLDRLGEAKQVAQLAAIVGRAFSYALIEAIADTEITALRASLALLVDEGILLQRGIPPESSYVFRHALLQDTAYESQLKSRRHALHARIARILEEHFPQRVAAEPALMARHCAEGGLVREAVEYFKQAGKQAVARLSNAEAVDYFSQALDQLASLPEDDARHQKEVELRLALGGPLAALRGYDDPEVIASCARSEELCDRIGSGPQQLGALLGLTLYHINCGHLQRARVYAESLLRIAEPLGIPALRVAGHMIRGTASITSATIPEACEDLEKAIAIASEAELAAPTAAFDVDALTVAHAAHAIALVIAGKPDSARLASERALRRGRALGHTRSYASALVSSATAHRFMEDAGRTRSLAEECLKQVSGRGFHTVECFARVQEGWARVRLGDLDGIAAVEHGLALASTTGTIGGSCQLYFNAAEAYELARRFDRAEQTLEQGAALIARTGEWMGYGPQAAMLRARILLASRSGTHAEAERLLHESLDGWTRSRSPWMALASSLLLARIALETGDKTAEARARLVELYAGFTEGFETPRLREARGMIDSLRR